MTDSSSGLAKRLRSTLGGIDDLVSTHHLVFGVGALVSRYAHAAVLDPIYGEPTSAMVFVRAKIE